MRTRLPPIRPAGRRCARARQPDEDEHCALGRRLRQDLTPRCAERRPQLHLTTPPAGTHEQQVGEVRARHQKYAAHTSEQKQHWPTDIARDEHRQRRDLLCEHGHPLPLADRQRRLTSRQFGTRLFRADPEPQAADDRPEATDIFIAIDGQRQIHVDGRPCKEAARERKIWGQYADDEMRDVLDRDRAANDGGIGGEASLPVTV
jgi:hypothetical protein